MHSGVGWHSSGSYLLRTPLNALLSGIADFFLGFGFSFLGLLVILRYPATSQVLISLYYATKYLIYDCSIVVDALSATQAMFLVSAWHCELLSILILPTKQYHWHRVSTS